MSQICKYFLTGNCRFGDRCKFVHSYPESDYGPGYREKTKNSYSKEPDYYASRNRYDYAAYQGNKGGNKQYYSDYYPSRNYHDNYDYYGGSQNKPFYVDDYESAYDDGYSRNRSKNAQRNTHDYPQSYASSKNRYSSLEDEYDRDWHKSQQRSSQWKDSQAKNAPQKSQPKTPQWQKPTQQYNAQSQRLPQPRSSQGPNQPKASGNVVVDTVAYLINEVKQIKNSGMWPLTVLGIVNEGNLPNWEDVSPEEVRYAYYLTVPTGQGHLYLQNWNSMLKKVEENRLFFAQPTKESAALVTDMLQNKIGGSGGQQSVFGSAVHNDPAPGLFGRVALKSNASFSDQQPSQFQSFSSSPFGSSTNIFGSAGSSSVEEVQMQDDEPNSSVFGRDASAYDQKAFVRSSFPPASHFGGSAPSLFGSVPLKGVDPKTKTYSDVSTLTEEELAQFRAPTFQFRDVPYNPPPRHLCMF